MKVQMEPLGMYNGKVKGVRGGKEKKE
jgi:hypothetical protein